MSETVLVIKHGALGDIILATGPFAAIRAHHPDARIVALTTKGFAALMESMPWFDEVWVDPRPRWWRPDEWLALRTRLRSAGFDRVYDLQTSQRSSTYFRWIFGGGVPWSGIAKGASFRHDTPERTSLHTIDRQRQQLAIAGIADVPLPDLSFLKADLARFQLPARYALLVPGGSAHRSEKRWPVASYAELAAWFAGVGIAPVLIGSQAEEVELGLIAGACPGVRNLCGKTSLAEIAALARGAVVAVGNDTGPLHLMAAAGCPSVALFSRASDPVKCKPVGSVTLREESLGDLPLERVLEAVRSALAHKN